MHKLIQHININIDSKTFYLKYSSSLDPNVSVWYESDVFFICHCSDGNCAFTKEAFPWTPQSYKAIHFRYLNKRARTLYVLHFSRYEFNQIDWHLHLQRKYFTIWFQHLAEQIPSVCTKLISRSPINRFNVENEICNENKDGYSYTSGI